jgi:hypothetical protein
VVAAATFITQRTHAANARADKERADDLAKAAPLQRDIHGA